MPLDSHPKRRSAATAGPPIGGPSPHPAGALDYAERQVAAWSYCGIPTFTPGPVYRTDANLQALWLLEEESGTRYDETGNDNDLTDNNTVLYSSDSKQGTNSADFESANNEYLEIADGSQTGLDVTGDLTILAWAKFESISADQAIVAKYDASGNDRAYLVWFENTGATIYFNVSSNGTAITNHESCFSLTAGVWYHVACVYNSTDLRIYVNGILAGVATAYSSGINDSAASFRLGRHTNNTWPYDGLLDEVAVFDRALSRNEVFSVYLDTIQEAANEGERGLGRGIHRGVGRGV
jgi:hypothetical protein